MRYTYEYIPLRELTARGFQWQEWDDENGKPFQPTPYQRFVRLFGRNQMNRARARSHRAFSWEKLLDAVVVRSEDGTHVGALLQMPLELALWLQVQEPENRS